MTYIRKVITKSGATAVQLATKRGGNIVRLEHLGSAHSSQELATLIALAKARLYRNQPSLFPENPPALNLRLRQATSQLFLT